MDENNFKLCQRCKIILIEMGDGWCKDCTKNYLREYKKNNKEHLRELTLQWRNDNREYHTNSRYEYYSSLKGRLIELTTRSKRRAKLKNIDFDLTATFLETLWNKQGGKCPISGYNLIIPQERTNNISSPFSPSIDRINPKKGYTQDNVRIVCFIANCALHDYGENIFNIIVEAIINKNIINYVIDEQNISNLDKRQLEQKKYLEGEIGITTQLFNNSKRNAKNKIYDFDINKNDIKELFFKQNNKCAISNIPFNNKIYLQDYSSNPFKASIDRIDCNSGYIQNNIRLVCISINFGLNIFGETLYKEMCQNYYNLHHL